ncbi:unnamed protein product [Dibothriocephalus latus]|uniref:DNA repair metallo-beta-lactamase domain-containing protein n=1 Tax=Dibothriocephalus latus TaxID=60516 RepID=A0A3P6Q0D7_DIBLA|nr:unnamed protein product [Dibothriocephalus latus]
MVGTWAAYSEHSSFAELRDFVTTLRPLKVQQTVFGGAAKEAKEHINSWLSGTPELPFFVLVIPKRRRRRRRLTPAASVMPSPLPSTRSVTSEVVHCLIGIFEEDNKNCG